MSYFLDYFRTLATLVFVTMLYKLAKREGAGRGPRVSETEEYRPVVYYFSSAVAIPTAIAN